IEEEYIKEVDAEERTLTIKNKLGEQTLTVPEDTSFDFEHALGREATVWFNKEEELKKYVLTEQTVKYDAVKFKLNNSDNLVAELQDEDKEYRVNDREVEIIKDNTNFNIAPGNTLDYAKLVFNSSNRVVAVVGIENWDDSILVESTEDDAVLGYEDEISLTDYTIVKDGRTIKVSDIETNDIVFYNVEAEYAEVYTNTVTG